MVIGVSLAVTFWLRRSAGTRTEQKIPSRVVAQYGTSFRAFAVFIILFAVVITTIAIAEGPRQLLWKVLSLTLFDGAAIFMLIEAFGVRIEATENGLLVRSPWRQSRRIAWDEITRFDYAPINQWHRIWTKSQGIVRLSDFLPGKQDVLDHIRRNCPGIPVT